MVVDEGWTTVRPSRGARSWGRARRCPDNLEVEAAVREHIAIFHADTQPAELRAPANWRWSDGAAAEFRPMSAARSGTAPRPNCPTSPAWLFSDDPPVEIELINRGVDYEASSVTGLHATRSRR